MGLSSRRIAVLTCVTYIVGLSSAWPQDLFNQKSAFDAKNVTPLVAIREIGLQSHAPIGIVIGPNQSALCAGRVSFALHEVTPRDALEEAVRSTNYSVEEQNGIILLMAPDINSHQRTLLTHRFKEFRTGRETDYARNLSSVDWMAMGRGRWSTGLWRIDRRLDDRIYHQPPFVGGRHDRTDRRPDRHNSTRGHVDLAGEHNPTSLYQPTEGSTTPICK